MKRLFMITAVTLTIATTMQAQVVTWTVKPGLYSKIEPCWGNLFLVYDASNHVGVVNGDGQTVVPTTADRITGFHDGLALVLKNEGGQERILGILAEEGAYRKTDGTYFTIPYQEFFSENLLTITDQGGNAGFMNANGVVVETFDVSFVSPFSEGYAVVGEGRDYSLVDKRYSPVRIRLGTVASILGGTGVYNGTAIVWADGKYYEVDPQDGVGHKCKKPTSRDCDYLYCFSELTGRPAMIDYDEPRRPSTTIEATADGGVYGYAVDGKTILPPQLDQAESFHGNYAIARLGGEYGLLAYHNDAIDFAATAGPGFNYSRNAGKNLKHKLSVTVPAQIAATDVNVRVKDENGTPMTVTGDGQSYEFTTNGPSTNGRKSFKVEIDGCGLRQWSGTIAYNYSVKSEPVPQHSSKRLTVKLTMGNTQADANNKCYVKATVTNPNPEAITTTVTFRGSSNLQAMSRTITVGAHASKEVTTYFTVTKAVTGQSVTATTSDGATATLRNLQLIPF